MSSSVTTGRATNGTVYTLSGPMDAPAVALIHGLGLTRDTWRALEPALAARYRVLNYDLFGHGESPLPAGDTDLTLFARQLGELLDELEIQRVALVGFSLGGMINRRFALDFPGRASALVILNSPHERDPADQARVEQRALDSASGGPGANLDATIDRWFTPEFQRARPDVIDGIRRGLLANDPDAYARCRRVLAFGVPELVRPATPITLPTLVMTAENDSGSTPAMSHAIAGEISGARTVIVPGLQHMALVEAPGKFTAPIVEFLGAVLP